MILTLNDPDILKTCILSQLDFKLAQGFQNECRASQSSFGKDKMSNEYS